MMRNHAPKRQQGVVLFIALIVLVAMTLAGLGMMRSVDTTNVIAGNLAFKQSTINASDQGLLAGYQWLMGQVGSDALNNSVEQIGYYSSRPGTDPDWFDPAMWNNATAINGGARDAAGNITKYVIHRMCDCANAAYNGTCPASTQFNQCALYYPSGGATTGGSMAVGSTVYQGTPMLYYRITARTEGPRNAVSITQAIVIIPN